MPGLADYLGALLSEVANARLQADLETSRIAQLYAAHPLLQRMPVPRFRLPTVTLELPLAVEAVEAGRPPAPVAADVTLVRGAVDAVIDQELAAHGIRLSPSGRKRMAADLDALFVSLSDSMPGPVDLSRSTDAIVAAVASAIRAVPAAKPSYDAALESILRRRLAAELLRLQPPLPRVEVLVTAAQLRDVAPPSVLTRVRLAISEEGVEWTQTNPDDATTRTLVPE